MSGIRSLYRGSAQKGPASAASAPIRVDSTTNQIVFNGTGSGTTEIGAQMTGGASAGEVVITTNVIVATEAGKTFFLDLVGGFTSTLPAHSATPIGARFRFCIQTSPTTAYIIVSDSADVNTMMGGINELEVDTADDGPYSSGADTFTFVANLAVAGDWVEFINSGTKWLVTGQTNADGGATIA